jgi:hypothetical protein
MAEPAAAPTSESDPEVGSNAAIVDRSCRCSNASSWGRKKKRCAVHGREGRVRRADGEKASADFNERSQKVRNMVLFSSEGLAWHCCSDVTVEISIGQSLALTDFSDYHKIHPTPDTTP